MPIYNLGNNATVLNGSASSGGGGGTTAPSAPPVITSTLPVATGDWVQAGDKYTFTIPAIAGVTEVLDINGFDTNKSVGICSEILTNGDIVISVNALPDSRFDGSITVIGA